MSHLLTLHVFAADFPETQGRALLAWCLAHGADTFTVRVIGAPPGVEAYGAALDASLASFAVAASHIPVIPKDQQGTYWTRPPQLWRLTPQSAEVLWKAMNGNLLSYFPEGDAWLEDPAFYRGPDLLLGIISHESEGVLRIRPAEQLSLHEAGIPYRLKGEWAGY